MSGGVCHRRLSRIVSWTLCFTRSADSHVRLMLEPDVTVKEQDTAHSMFRNVPSAFLHALRTRGRGRPRSYSSVGRYSNVILWISLISWLKQKPRPVGRGDCRKNSL